METLQEPLIFSYYFSITIFQKFFVWWSKIFHREVFNLLFHCDLDSGMQVEKTLTELLKKMKTLP